MNSHTKNSSHHHQTEQVNEDDTTMLLENLAELLENGDITQEEFRQQKAKILRW